MSDQVPRHEIIPGGVRLVLPPRAIHRGIGVGLILGGLFVTLFMVFWMGGAGGWWEQRRGIEEAPRVLDWFRLGFSLLGTPGLAVGLGMIYAGMAIIRRWLITEVVIDHAQVRIREYVIVFHWSWSVPLGEVRSLHLHQRDGNENSLSLRLRRTGRKDLSVSGYSRAEFVGLARMLADEVQQRRSAITALPLLERSDEGPAPGNLAITEAEGALTIACGAVAFQVAKGRITLRKGREERWMPIAEVRSIAVPPKDGSGRYQVPGRAVLGVVPVVVTDQGGVTLIGSIKADPVAAAWIVRRLEVAVRGLPPAEPRPMGLSPAPPVTITEAVLPTASPVVIRGTIDGVRIVCPVRGLGAAHGAFAMGIMVVLFVSGFLVVPLLVVVQDMPLLVRGFLLCFGSVFIVIGVWAAVFGLRLGTRHTEYTVAARRLRITWQDRLGSGTVDHATAGLIATCDDTGTRTNDKIHWRLTLRAGQDILWKGGQELDHDEQLAVAAALNRALSL